MNGREVEVIVLDNGIPVLRHSVREQRHLVREMYDYFLSGEKQKPFVSHVATLAAEFTNLVWPVLTQPFVLLSGESKAEFNLRRRHCWKGTRPQLLDGSFFLFQGSQL